MTTTSSVLAELQANSLAVLFSTQTHAVGFPSLTVTEHGAVLSELLNEREQQVLALYEKLQQLNLQKKVLEQQQRSGMEEGNRNDEDADEEEQLDKLENEVVQARASHNLKQTIVEMMLSTDPVLRSIHAPDISSAKDRSLLSLLARRDTLSLTHANLSHSVQTTLSTLTSTQRSVLAAQQKNRALAAKLLKLVEEQKQELRRKQGPEYQRAEEELKGATVRWDVVRNIVQAVVISSGVDWSRDEKLRELVLGCGDD